MVILSPLKLFAAQIDKGASEGEAEGRASERRKGGNAGVIPVAVLDSIELILD
jgi:hypothetical protein